MKKYVFGNPVQTEAVLEDVPVSEGLPEIADCTYDENGFELTYKMEPDEIVYGLGESNRGMNKRGWEYVQNVIDDPDQHEGRRCLYAAHNFIIVDGKKPFGIFVDDPSSVYFDIGYHRHDTLQIHAGKDLNVYILEGDSAYEIAREFRKAIGQSYIPPLFGFGYAQSRWGYKTKDDFRAVADGYQKNNIPIDMINIDIDYMQDYKDFTLNEQNMAQNFPAFVQEMKDRNIHLVPIIDAAIKEQDGYSVYEEGKEKKYFCKNADGTDFEGAAWPGYAMFTDFLNTEARTWFGNQYKVLTDAGIDAFWNDMNEPAIFFSRQGIDQLKEYLKTFIADERNEVPIFELGDEVAKVKNSPEDYKRFYHDMDGRVVRHDKVHNLYGYYMTRAAGEAFDRIRPDERTLMYSRSSYIGMHRYGGIWSGDNKAWWSHILLMIHQLPNINMAGFLYTGCDLGGFGEDTTRDLLQRFLQLGVFTPLMRNHASMGTREQEVYQFEDMDELAHLIRVRYRLIPYLYSEYMKAALENDLMFKPLSFVYPQDKHARTVEDQLMIGDELMIAPVYTQNAAGRYVYLPEEMMLVRFPYNGNIETNILEAGHHYIDYDLNEIVFFIHKDRAIPVIEPAMSTAEMDMDTMEMIGYENAAYELYSDDGISKETASKTKTLSKPAHESAH